MRKLITLLGCLILFVTASKSQYVNIADSGFRVFLQYQYPDCFNGAGQMDTTCTAIVNEDSLSLSGYIPSSSNMEGLRYFKNLIYLNTGYGYYGILPELPSTLLYLNCSSTNITNLPTLPTGLLSLTCTDCSQLTGLPVLPNRLRYLNVDRCGGLTILPTLPDSLKYLSCNNIYQLTSLPALPEGLKYLDISVGNQISILPQLPNSLNYLNCTRNYGLVSLPALPTSLDSLFCSDCSLTSLPDLPNGLMHIECSNNQLLSLPALPAGLKYLNCNSNGSISIMPALPTGLTHLLCGGNRIQSLPALPSGLITLFCGRNMLETLPSIPNTLLNLNFYANQIRNFPALPNTLTELDCSMNPLYNLPVLPDSLRTLYCYYDSLSVLPALPGNLITLYCLGNQLSSLPALPANLYSLNCSHNQLTGLPDLPGTLSDLWLNSNSIYCLPKLPVLTGYYPYLQVYFDGDKIKCIPNFSPNINLQPLDSTGGYMYRALPLCNPTNNISHCNAFPVMNGIAFYDNNNNGLKDINEPVKRNIQVTLSNGSYTFTNNNGYYEIGADSIGSYTITPAVPTYFNAAPPSHTYNFTGYDTLVTNNFALQPNTAIDSLTVKLTALNWAARPGFSFPFLVSYENTGTTTLSPNIVLEYDNSRLMYDSSSNAAVVNNTTELSLTVGSFTPGEQGSFIGYFRLKPAAVIGDSLFSKLTVSAGSHTYVSNHTAVIGGSFDPNDKHATPQLSPAQVANGQYIDYTIRFQNTGTDTAFNIVVSDTLSDNLQAGTLQMLNASHSCKTTVTGNVVFFEFNNILLPDSNVNEPKSHGLVSFRIKPETAVQANTTIHNKAAIYFDYNAPVITNTANTLIKDFTVIPLKLTSFSAVPQTDNTTNLYWNTSNEINTKNFIIEQGGDGLHFNALTSVNAKGSASNNYNLTVNDFNEKIVYYRLKIIDNNGSFSYSPIIKIDRRKNTTGLSILTNPIKDFIVINSNDRELNNTQCNIINTNGIVVKTFMIRQGSQAIDVTGLVSGMYYIRTVSGSERLLIQ